MTQEEMEIGRIYYHVHRGFAGAFVIELFTYNNPNQLGGYSRFHPIHMFKTMKQAERYREKSIKYALSWLKDCVEEPLHGTIEYKLREFEKELRG